MRYRVMAPMGLTLPAGTELANLSDAQLARLRLHLEPKARGALRVLAQPAQFKRGEEVELPKEAAKALRSYLEHVAEPTEEDGKGDDGGKGKSGAGGKAKGGGTGGGSLLGS